MSAAVQEFDRATQQLRLTREREAREWATLSARLAAKYTPISRVSRPATPKAGNGRGTAEAETALSEAGEFE